MERPNILWICTDSQRHDTLGCYGNHFVQTPNIDALAQNGVLFEHAFAQSPVCMPSRGSFLTGRYPSATRLRGNGQECPPDLVPVTKTFADAGYGCGLVGKFHLNPCDRRFTLGETWWEHPKSEWLMPREARIDDGYAEFHWDHAPNAEAHDSDYTRWLRAQNVEFERRPFSDCDYVKAGMPANLSQTHWCAQTAIDFIERAQNGAQPWLFSVNMFDPHYAFDPPRECLERYRVVLDQIPLPDYIEGELADKPAHQRAKHEKFAGYPFDAMSERDHRWVRAAYWAMCDHIDAQVGRILAALEATKQRENTLVVFMSDHGELLGDHGIYTKGAFLYDPAVRVPLILNWPGQLNPRRVEGLVELTDLAPALLQAAELPPDVSMQGRSLWPLATGETDEAREDIYVEAQRVHSEIPAINVTMVRTATHKLAVTHGSGEGELYDLQADPTEARNLWNHADYADVRSAMMLRLLKRMNDAMDDPLPARLGVF